ncbi:alpha/beta hydrolase [Streptomyces sp. NPDC046887]|uniref:alpha/beta hydrolase n=1 Tax=Streptomyces sp. NPDC046887 TaxID=3155472 RepID=UPI0033F181C2
MKIRLRLLLAAALAATLLVPATAATAADAATTTPLPTAARPPSAPPSSSVPALTWRPCATPQGPVGQECAVLPVPLDYRDSAGPRIDLAVSRVRSERPEARRGVLLVLPGGPGGPGIPRLTAKGAALAAATGGIYDLVAFDPRGTGESTKASCGLAAEDRFLVNLRAWPAPDGGIGENVARARRTAEACARHGGPVLSSLSTANEVRDMDRLRQALGERKLSAWGVSYGVYPAAVYAQLHPDRTDRWVLDSAGDPDPRRLARGWKENMSLGAHQRFPDFAAWAADPPPPHEKLRLAERAEDVLPLVLDLAARLDHEPRPSTTPGVPLTGNVLRQAVQNALFADAAFPALAELIQTARRPEGVPVLPAPLAAPLSDTEAAVSIAVICNDLRWSGTPASYARAVTEDRARYPLTAGAPANITPCTFWRDAPADQPVRITSRGPSNILMIQALRDPATPYSGALNMRQALGDRTRLVTLDRGGHGMYLANGNACGDRLVTDFLTTGTRPDHDTTCPG